MAFYSLNLFAPAPDKVFTAHMKEFEKVASISDSIDVNHIGVLTIPLQPFVEISADNHTPFSISSKYGYRMHPVLRVVLLHTGIDVVVRKNEPIYASGDGEVVKVVCSKFGYGNHIVLKHKNEFKTLYAHLNKILIKEGDYVHAGDMIGLAGQTGLVWGKNCHIHFELMYKGQKVNPLPFINAKNSKEFGENMCVLTNVKNYYLEQLQTNEIFRQSQ